MMMPRIKDDKASVLPWRCRQLACCLVLTVGVLASAPYGVAGEVLEAPATSFARADAISDTASLPSSPRCYDELVNRVASEFGLDASLLHAIISAESGYKSDVVSPKGATGLMQVTPGVALSLGYSDLYDPYTNLRAGATHLKSLLERFNNNLELAVAAYNAGEGAVRRYGCQVPPYKETQAYVRTVLARYQQSPSLVPKDVAQRRAILPAMSVKQTSASEMLVKLTSLLVSEPYVASVNQDKEARFTRIRADEFEE
jgi:hypothetical protein